MAAGQRIPTSVKFVGLLKKRNETHEPNRLFLKKWFTFRVTLDDHHLKFFKNNVKVRIPSIPLSCPAWPGPAFALPVLHDA